MPPSLKTKTIFPGHTVKVGIWHLQDALWPGHLGYDTNVAHPRIHAYACAHTHKLKIKKCKKINEINKTEVAIKKIKFLNTVILTLHSNLSISYCSLKYSTSSRNLTLSQEIKFAKKNIMCHILRELTSYYSEQKGNQMKERSKWRFLLGIELIIQYQLLINKRS